MPGKLSRDSTEISSLTVFFRFCRQWISLVVRGVSILIVCHSLGSASFPFQFVQFLEYTYLKWYMCLSLFTIQSGKPKCILFLFWFACSEQLVEVLAQVQVVLLVDFECVPVWWAWIVPEPIKRTQQFMWFFESVQFFSCVGHAYSKFFCLLLLNFTGTLFESWFSDFVRRCHSACCVLFRTMVNEGCDPYCSQLGDC